MDKITTKCVNGELNVGDLVISTPVEEYSCLIGRVMKINLLGTPEHEQETVNDTDDVHINFLEFDYSRKRIKEIEEMFSDLYCTKKRFNELPLDDAIIAPECLIRITELDEEILQNLLENGYNAACYCYGVLSSQTRQSEADNTVGGNSSDIKAHIFKVIDSALAIAGYKVMDGDRNSVIIRHSPSDTDYEIKVEELPG